MRRLLFVVLIALVGGLAPRPGWTASDPDQPRRIRVIKPAPRPAPERPRPKAPPAARSPAPAGPPLLWAYGAPDATQCRRACAQQRYFCDAGGGGADCPATWRQCAAACGSPNLRPALGLAP